MARELRLVVKTNQGRHLGSSHAAAQMLLRARDAQVHQVLVRRQPYLQTEGSTEVELVEPGVVRKELERHGLVESIAEELQRAADRARMLGLGAADDQKRADCLDGRYLEGESIFTRPDGIDETVEGGGAFVIGCQLRDRHHFAFVLHSSDFVCRQRDTREGRRSVASNVTMHVAGLLHENAAGLRAPHPAASPPLGVAAFDAPDAEVLLHFGVKRLRRDSRSAQARQRQR